MDQSEPESTDVAIVSPNADITLVVGPNKKQIRVQSVFLTETSKPFAAMLSGTLKDPNTKVIELPDDNADAMVQICIALHRHYNELSTNPPPATVLEFAIIADKYLLLETLSCVARRYWLSAQAVGKPFHAVQRHGLIGMLQYATAAWIFDDADAFWSHTRGLIIDWEDSYIVEKGTRLDIVMDQAISAALEEQRSKIKFRLLQIPFEALEAKGCERNCGWAARQALYHLKVLQEDEQFAMIKYLGVSEILKIFRDFPPPNNDLDIHCSGETCHGVHDWEAWHTGLLERARDSSDRSAGLCLFCCKAGVWTRFCFHAIWRLPYALPSSF